MTASSKTFQSAATRPKIASASVNTSEPNRGGSVRVALVATTVALLSAAASFLGSQWVAERDALRHLGELRDAARQDLSQLFEETGSRTRELAKDPVTIEALRSFEDGFRDVARALAASPAEEIQSRRDYLKEFYATSILPMVVAGGHSLTFEEIYPDDPTTTSAHPALLLQDLYLNPKPRPASAIQQRKGAGYAAAHERFHEALAGQTSRAGWTNLHLIDDATGSVVYSANKSVETFTGLRDGVHRNGALARTAAQATSAEGTAETVFIDSGFGPLDEGTQVFFSTPVFSGQQRIGTLVSSIDVSEIDKALLPGDSKEKWARADLGTRGQVVAIASDGSLVSTPRRSGASPSWSSRGLRDALAGEPVEGQFEIGGEKILASYAPLQVGADRWVIAAEQPRQEVLTPLAVLLPILAGIVLLASLTGWLLGARLWNQYSRQVRQVSRLLQKAQRGDRDLRLEIRKQDAVGELSETVNRLLEERSRLLDKVEVDQHALQESVHKLLEAMRQASSGGPLVHAEVGDGELGNISSALNEVLDVIEALSQSMLEASSEVSHSASDLRVAAEEASTNAANQARMCRETEGSAESLREEGSQIAAKCQAALEIARRTENASALGGNALRDLTGSMEGLQRETRGATVKIKRLSERSMQISAIIGTISKMSAQTDMLALNAAIEASRAGEQGQGFALVADEVRKLAERAAASAKEIERIIDGIQSDIGEAVSGMERQGERIELQTTAASEAQRALDKVASVTRETTAAMEGLAENADAQASAASEFSGVVSQIAAAASDVKRSSDRTRENSVALAKLSDDLRDRVPSAQD